MPRKASPRTAEEQWPSPVVSALRSWFFTEHPPATYAQAVDRMKAQFGIETNDSTLTRFWQRETKRQTRAQSEANQREDLMAYLREGTDQAQATVNAPGSDPVTFMKACLVQLGALNMKLTRAGELSAEEIETVNVLTQTLIKGARELRGLRAVTVSEGKLALLERQAAKADRAERILSDPGLDEAQRAARMREVFHMAS